MSSEEVLQRWSTRLNKRAPKQLRLTRSLSEQIDEYPTKTPLMIVSIEEIEVLIKATKL